MAYYHQKLLSAKAGGSIGHAYGVTPMTDSDIGGHYQGDFRNQFKVPTSDGADSIYYSSPTGEFRVYRQVTGRAPGVLGWYTVDPTDTRVLGNTNKLWLGGTGGAPGSEEVNSYTEAIEFLAEGTIDLNRYDEFYYYDKRLYSDRGSGIQLTDGPYNVYKMFNYDSTLDTLIKIENHKLDKSYFNRAVTFDRVPVFDITNPTVRLALDNEVIIGSIVGYSYSKLQIATDGWDIRFINGTANSIRLGSKIIGKAVNNKGGYVQPVYDKYTELIATTDETNISKSRGWIIDPGDDGQAGTSVVRAAMQFGGW